MSDGGLYKVGDVVPESGTYMCVACGSRAEFVAGEKFAPCDDCEAGTPDGPGGYDNPEVEFWKRV